MSVQYKSSDGWKNISSSSNNAVDTVADGNMNPVTSNAVYDKFASTAAVDSVTNGDLHPVTSNAVYDYPIDSITDGQHRPPTSNAVYDALNTKQDVIKTITVHANTWRDYTTVENRITDWVQANIASPDIPSGYIALRYFAEVSEVQNGHVDCYPTYTGFNGIPNCIALNTDGQVTTCKLRLGAICIKL